MKKKIISTMCILIVVVLLFPFPLHLKDGGTIEYRAALYCVSDVHRLAPQGDEVAYKEGTIIEIFGIEVFNNVK